MTATQKWITLRTLALMEERKQMKPPITRSKEDKERYQLKDKKVRNACEEDKKDYIEGHKKWDKMGCQQNSVGHYPPENADLL